MSNARRNGVHDLVVRNGRVFVPGGSLQIANVAVDDGLVTSITSETEDATTVIDAAGMLVLPGAIDAHTHLNSVWPFPDERRPADDFGSGTRSAAAGGVTAVCDFVYPLPGESLRQAIDRVVADASAKSHIDFGLHVVITTLENGFVDELPSVVADGYPSFKFYTQLPDFVARGSEYVRLLSTLAELGVVAMFHCEDAAIIDYCRHKLLDAGHMTPRHYPDSKPAEVEVAATALALNYSSVAGIPAYLVHLSAAGALAEARLARRRGQKVFVETRPLYLYLTKERFSDDDAIAARYVGTPPLRDHDDKDELWAGLASGEVDVVASDHVGFTLAQKHQPGDTFENVPKGVANLETIAPMLYSEGVVAGRITLDRFVKLVAENPAKIFGLYPRKGAIAPGSDADLMILDPSDHRLLTATKMHSASDFELFEGMTVKGWPAYTISRGEVIYDGKDVLSKPGRGLLVKGTKPVLEL